MPSLCLTEGWWNGILTKRGVCNLEDNKNFLIKSKNNIFLFVIELIIFLCLIIGLPIYTHTTFDSSESYWKNGYFKFTVNVRNFSDDQLRSSYSEYRVNNISGDGYSVNSISVSGSFPDPPGIGAITSYSTLHNGNDYKQTQAHMGSWTNVYTSNLTYTIGITVDNNNYRVAPVVSKGDWSHGTGYYAVDYSDTTSTSVSVTQQFTSDRDNVAQTRCVFVMPKKTTLTLNGNGGTSYSRGSYYNKTWGFVGGVSDSSRTGYSFKGWGTSSTASSYITSAVLSSYVSYSDAQYYALWTANRYTVTLDRQGATNGSGSTTATYDSAMPSITPPTKTGYTFQGYYTSPNGGGTRYYNSNGTSARNYDIANSTTLYAYWTANTYKISLDRQGATNGSSSVTATYGSVMPSISVPTKTGYIFQGYYTSTNGGGTKYYNSTGTSARNYDMAYATTLYAYWTPISYSINFNLGNGSWSSSSPTNNTQYDKAINIPAPRPPTGYTFAGWTSGTNFNSSTAQSGSESDSMSSWSGSLTKNTYFKNLTASDGTTVTLNANYSANNYTVTFEANGGTVSPTTKSVTYDSTYGDLPTPTRTGYSFTGWTLNGTKITSTTQVKTASNHTLVAQWQAISYTLTFDPNEGSVSPTTKTVTYDSAYGDLPIPTRTGYIFIGWYTSDNGGSQVLSNTTVKTADKHVLYAHWQDTWYSYATQPTGNGTSISPYIIDSAEDFAWIAKDIADNGTKSNYYKQTKLIDLSAHYWLPIGSDSNHSFNGLYDGQGFEIKNLNTYFPTNPDTPELQVNVGLFGYTAGSANIRGIVLRNATIKGAHNTGGIIGQATGKTIVKDIAVDNLNITTTMSYIGTIIGKSESTNVTIKNVVVYSATTSHNHRGLNSGEATIDSCLVSIQESKKYHDNTGDGFDFTQWVYISGLKMPVPKGLSWLANGGEPLTKEVLESLGFSAYQY